MADTDINTLKLTILEERAVMSLYDLSAKPLSFTEYLAECLARLCQGTPYLKPLSGACFFQRNFQMEKQSYELAAWRGLASDLIDNLRHKNFTDKRIDLACTQNKIQLSSNLVETVNIEIEGETARATYYLPLTTDEECFGVILLFLRKMHKPSRREIAFLKRSSKVIAQGLQQRQELDKWVHAYQELQINHVHQFTQITRLCQEISLPASAVHGVSEQLANKKISTIKNQTQLLRGSAGHLKTLVKKLNQYVVYGSKNIDVSEQLFSFSETFTHFLREVREWVEGRGLTFSLHVDSQIPAQLIGDSDKIRHILSILVDNAIKFTQAGEISVSIEKEAAQGNSIQLTFSVQDTGMGISNPDQQSLFDTQSRTHNEQAGDMPMIRHGLRLAKKYTEMMHGKLEVDSRIGVGSTFTVSIPLRAPAETTSGNTIETTLTMEAITVLPQNIISETERITSENRELIETLMNILDSKLRDYDITSDQAIGDIIPVLKNTVYRKDLKAIKSEINNYNFEAATERLQHLCSALGINLSND